jgi:hypothetical protein
MCADATGPRTGIQVSDFYSTRAQPVKQVLDMRGQAAEVVRPQTGGDD